MNQYFKWRDMYAHTPADLPAGSLELQLRGQSGYSHFCHMREKCIFRDRAVLGEEPCLSCRNFHKASHFVENKVDPLTKTTQIELDAEEALLIATDKEV